MVSEPILDPFVVWRPPIFGPPVVVPTFQSVQILDVRGCVRSPTLARDKANQVFIRVVQTSTLELAFVVEYRLILSLQNEIDDRDQKMMEMEHKHSEEVAMVRRVVIRLGEEIKYKEKSLLEMECKYNESLNKVHKLMKEKDEVHDAQEELHKMRVKNSKMNDDMECLKIDNWYLSKQLEESKALNDQQEKNFIEEIQKLKRIILQDQSHAKSGGSLNAEITTFRNQLQDKMDYLELVEVLNSSLVVKEHQYKQEILDVRKESLESLPDMFRGQSELGIKRLGELDPIPFQNFCLQRYSREQWPEIAAKLCSSWEENLKDSAWHPFKMIEVNGILQEVLDENDEKLKGLRNECGELVYKAVGNALMEIEEYNSSGRYAIPEI
ncbi:factor of DNA methylation 1-like [Lotus japonicus]|uniref:factor of DNA methylation 1-like n=1 Tax=Lotus japonicus TaxID=34305 RepID=UPI002589FFCD|nr:factor of DNA methylation 1-like [Lotus japonicus]